MRRSARVDSRKPTGRVIAFAKRSPLLTGLAFVILALTGVAIFAPILAPSSPTAQNYSAILQPPSSAHLFGTDSLGRDVLSRTIHGTRTSLYAGLLAVGIALIIGLPIGLISGYFGGWWDEIVVMRIVDAVQAFPFLILAMSVVAALGPSLSNAMIAIGIGLSPAFIRIVRSSAIQIREMEYVKASDALGATQFRTIVRHLLPNAFPVILVQIAVAMGIAIISESGLSYLGLGTQPPTPSWGSELRNAQGYLGFAPWLAIWPGIGIFVAVLAFNLLADELRNLLDPRLKN